MMFLITMAGLVCVGTGLLQYRQIRSGALRLLILCVVLSFVVDLIFERIPDPTGALTRAQYDLMLPVEFAIYVYLFQSKPGWLFWTMAAGLAAFGLYQLLFRLAVLSSATAVFRAMCLLMLPVILLYFRSLLLSRQLLVLWQEPLFWIATSLLFFYVGNVIATGFYFVLNERFPKQSQQFFYVNYALTLLRYAMFTIAFMLAGRQHRDG